MSSHHIVRDEQEPAVLILSFPPKAQSKILDDLLEWSPTVIIPDYLTEEAVLLGLKFDIVLYRSFHADSREKLSGQFPLKFVQVDKGDWVEVAINSIIQSGHKALSVLVQNFDYKIKSKVEDFQTVYYDYLFKWYSINGTHKKWFKEGQLLKILGKQYKIQGASQNPNGGSMHKVLKGGWVKITTSQTIWFGERII
ncbi:MAG: hypothetical protein AAF693_07345 [Bacteroidota bacterium]